MQAWGALNMSLVLCVWSIRTSKLWYELFFSVKFFVKIYRYVPYGYRILLASVSFWDVEKVLKLRLISLTLLWRRPLLYRNQSIDLQSKSMDYFLYDNGLRHERVKKVVFITNKCEAQDRSGKYLRTTENLSN